MNTLKHTFAWLLLIAIIATTCLSAASCSSGQGSEDIRSAIDKLQNAVDGSVAKGEAVQEIQNAVDALKASVDGIKIPEGYDDAETVKAISDLKSQVEALKNSVDSIPAYDDADVVGALEAVKGQVAGLKGSVDSVASDDSQAQSIAAVKALVEALQSTIDAAVAKDADIKQLQASIDKLTETVISLVPVEAPAKVLADDYGAECFEKIKYIDKLISDRDCYSGANYKFCIKWIKWNLIQAGYSESEIIEQDFNVTKYYSKSADLASTLSAVKAYSTDGKTYKKSGRNYVEDPDGTYVKVDITLCNIVVVKQGKSDDQIIIGAHFDGDGTGDNGSGVALALTTAQKVCKVETPNTLVFVFFTAEEYGCLGSTAYANAMTDEEVAKTLYMINLDSLVCGDYCYLYGGVADKKSKTVTKTEAYDNAMAVAKSIGLEFKSNPWTFENPEPAAKNGVPSYPAPATGDWSDHKGFKNRGIPYLYFEATNWEIPDYSGYGETYLIGMLMNTKNDYLEFIETYFPGRVLSHITQFSALMNALVMQENVSFGE